MKFRADIQILRGLSVLFVVLFHLGFQVFQSGFLGVDVFFVISGFLMAVLYDTQDKLGFFTRRAKRLLPAYYTVILFTLVGSFIFNTPNETKQVVSQAAYATAFSSNVGFWLQNSYFSKTEFNPLLHLWSLGVEIQFYLLIPVLAWLFSKNRFFLPAILLTSLLVCFFIIGISPKTSFFMMPFRIWEFLLGYGAALFLTNNGDIQHIKTKWVGAIALLALMLIPIINVDGKSVNFVSGHPGVSAFIISVSTSIVLIFGLPKAIENSYLGKTLVMLGKYSYSIYLVHFPIIVLFLSTPFSGTILTIPNLETLVTLLVLISLTSVLLHRFVETQDLNLNIFGLSAAISSLVILLTLLLPIIQNKNLPPKKARIYNAFNDRSTYRCGKIIRILEPDAISCVLTTTKKKTHKRLMLVGNSHADSIKSSFAEIAEENNSSLQFIVANNPLMKGGLTPESIVNEAVTHEIQQIILHYSPSAIEFETINQLVHLSKAKNIDVNFIDPIPVWSEHIPRLMYRNLKTPTKEIYQSKQDYLTKNILLHDRLTKISTKNFKQFSVVDYFCQPECIYKTLNGTPLYYDSGHLTLTGAAVLKDVFRQIINNPDTSGSSNID